MFHGEGLRVGRILGVDIKIHPTFWFLVLLFAFDGLRSGARGMLDALGWIALVFGSVLLHELAHAVVGRSRGAKVEDIVLLPIGGATRTHAFPERPRDEFLMTAVGPASSFVIAAAAAGFATLIGDALLPVNIHHGSLLGRIFWLNVFLGAFNLLPAFPMDGGRMLRAVLAARLGRVRATRVAATVGRLAAGALGVIGIYANFFLVIIAIFVFLGATAEQRAVEISAVLHPYRVRDAVRGVALAIDARLLALEAARRALEARTDAVIVLTEASQGIATTDALIAAARADPATTALKAARFDLPTVAAGDPLDSALLALSSAGATAVSVVEGGRVTAVLTVRDIQRFAELSALAA